MMISTSESGSVSNGAATAGRVVVEGPGRGASRRSRSDGRGRSGTDTRPRGWSLRDGHLLGGEDRGCLDGGLDDCLGLGRLDRWRRLQPAGTIAWKGSGSVGSGVRPLLRCRAGLSAGVSVGSTGGCETGSSSTSSRGSEGFAGGGGVMITSVAALRTRRPARREPFDLERRVRRDSGFARPEPPELPPLLGRPRGVSRRWFR